MKHVSNLRKNLISLGALDSKDCKGTAVAGVLKIVKGAMFVMKGEMVLNLYRFIGDTIPCGAVIHKTLDDNGWKHIV